MSACAARKPSCISCSIAGKSSRHATSFHCTNTTPRYPRGVMRPPPKLLTSDGYDLQFGTNVLGHHILTTQLLPQLIAGAKSSPDGKARVVTTSSLAHLSAPSGAIAWDCLDDSLDGGKKRRAIGKMGLYGMSKIVGRLLRISTCIDEIYLPRVTSRGLRSLREDTLIKESCLPLFIQGVYRVI